MGIGELYSIESSRRVRLRVRNECKFGVSNTSLLIMENEQCLHGGERPAVRITAGPDGLEAWLVALAACFINFVMAGLGRMSGILYVALIDKFQTDRRQASLPFTIRSSTRNLLGPIVGILGQKYGVRPVIIVGGIIGTLSAAACFDINDIRWITVVWGGINGIGISLTTTLPQVVIGQHFEKYRATASGIAFSGGCVGSFLFPALIEHLLHTYDLGGTFLIIGGIIFHVVPASIILKKPSWWKRKNTTEKKVLTPICEKEQNTTLSGFYLRNEAKTNDTETVNDYLPQVESGFTQPNSIPSSTPLLYRENSAKRQTCKCNIDSDFLLQNRHILMKVLTNDFTLQYDQSEVKYNKFFHTDDVFVKEIELLLRQLETNASNGDIDFIDDCSNSVTSDFQNNIEESAVAPVRSGSLKHQELNGEADVISIHYVAYYIEKLFERDKNEILKNFSEEQQKNVKKILEDLEKLHNSFISYRNNINFITQLSNDSEFLQTGENERIDSCKRSNTFYSHIKTALKLYTKPMFILICLCRAAHFMTFVPIVTVVVDFTMDKGHQAEDGKYVIGSLSFGDLLGRLCLGWITDRGYVTLPRYMLIVMILQGVTTVSQTLMQSAPSIMTSVAVFGLFQGAGFIQHPVLVARYLGEHEQSISMGCINFFSGLIGLLLPLYIGYFRDTVGSYDGLFYVSGSAEAFIGFLWLFEPYLLKLSRKSDPNEHQQIDV